MWEESKTCPADSSKYIGGIVGSNNGELTNNLVLSGNFSYTSGAVVGTNTGMLHNNLYTARVRGINKGTVDGDILEGYGAVKAYNIIAGEHVTTKPLPSDNNGTVCIDGEYYYASGVTANLELGYDGNVPEGYEAQFLYYENGYENYLAMNEDGTYTITMGDADFRIYAILKEKKYTKGDVNGDGDITAQDASLILQAVAGKIVFTDEQSTVADVNGDGDITAQDASLILQYVAGKTSW